MDRLTEDEMSAKQEIKAWKEKHGWFVKLPDWDEVLPLPFTASASLDTVQSDLIERFPEYIVNVIRSEGC